MALDLRTYISAGHRKRNCHCDLYVATLCGAELLEPGQNAGIGPARVSCAQPEPAGQPGALPSNRRYLVGVELFNPIHRLGGLGHRGVTGPGHDPFYCGITEVSASAGQVVNGGQSVLTLATGEARDVVFDIAKPEAIPPQEQAGLRVSLLSDPSVQASAAVRDISPQADPQTRTWRVRATLQNPPLAMALGASVTVTLPATGPHGYALPASALSRVDDKPAVYVINPQSQAQLRVVVPAYYTATTVIISGGLEPGDRVITAGVSKLRSGEPVIAGECES